MTALMAVGTVGCADNAANNAENTGSEQVQQAAPADAQQTESTSDGPKILKTAASFAYPSLDVHKEYYGWYTSIYGVSEAFFKMDDKMTAAPCLAEDAVADGSVWTITLKDGVAFSNGTPLTSEMVIKNL
ncbi:ABC transporter substrate-binding protein [Butyrivibrio sp. XPD2006]|uniref:ABC transporter substrate-binding protein n=1 Tax=Butyrivibrio sp. XPD2006 TaxID=1280668 RepID=UPI0003B697FE|nr:ABC transporter substrate-binding protein [Butyrivibrio sp. XPD2006]